MSNGISNKKQCRKREYFSQFAAFALKFYLFEPLKCPNGIRGRGFEIGNVRRFKAHSSVISAFFQRIRPNKAGCLICFGGLTAVVVCTCKMNVLQKSAVIFKGIKIDPEVMDPEEVEMLEDLVMAAVNEAMTQCEETTAREMNKITGGMKGLPF